MEFTDHQFANYVMQHVITSEFHPEAREYVVKNAILYVLHSIGAPWANLIEADVTREVYVKTLDMNTYLSDKRKF